ncbi:MAG TPA: hypothetical protein VFF04_04150 [Candidatus Babeliales bacterium]|nr:hypothetical protein [Candidatus Babeliales bacterium]
MKRHINTAFFYGLILLFLFIDICCFAFLEQPLINTLLCFYIVLLLQSNSSIIQLTAAASGLLLEFFVFYGRFIPSLVIIIPLTLIGLLIRKICYPNKSLRYGLLTATIVAQTYLVEPYFFHSQRLMTYTIMKVFANILVMIPFP